MNNDNQQYLNFQYLKKLKGIKQFTNKSSVLLSNKVKPQEQPDKIREGAKLLLIGSFDSERLFSGLSFGHGPFYYVYMAIMIAAMLYIAYILNY